MIPKYHINLFWSEPDGAWVPDEPGLRSVSAFGDTPAEALAEIELAIALGSRLPHAACWMAPVRRKRSLDASSKSVGV
jgi:hypothetical protein